MTRRLLLLPLVLSACATAPEPKPHAVAPAYKSSIDAVKAHAAELALTDEQTRKLTELEERRERQDEESRSRARSQGEAQSAAPPPPAGGRGRGMGRRGGGYGGTQAQASRDPGLNQQFDDHDTQAFTAALELLTEAQKPRAIELASKYREELFDYRQSLR